MKSKKASEMNKLRVILNEDANITKVNDVLFSKVTQAYSEKRNPSAPIRSRT